MPAAQRQHPGPQGLVMLTATGRVSAVISPGAMRLLLGLSTDRGVMPIQQATRTVWPDQVGALTASQRASAARTITRLVEHGLLVRRDGGVALTINGALFVLIQRIDVPRPSAV